MLRKLALSFVLAATALVSITATTMAVTPISGRDCSPAAVQVTRTWSASGRIVPICTTR